MYTFAMRCVLSLAFLLAASSATAQWQIVAPAPTTSDLHAIDNAGNGIAWAAGSNGTVLRSIDNGAHWQLCAIPPGAEHLDLRGIQAFDASTTLVISTGKGPLSRLYKTVDGCQTWMLLFTNPTDNNWTTLAEGPIRVKRDGSPAEPSGPLYILGNPAETHSLNDLGDFSKTHLMVWVIKQPWKSGELPKLERPLPPAKPGESVSLASNSVLFPVPAHLGIAVNSQKGPLWMQLLENLSDTTPRWYSYSLLNKAGCPSLVVSSVAFTPSGKTGVAVGGDPAMPDDATGNEAYTDNGGRDWNSCLSGSSPRGYRSAVAYDAASKTWITVGPNGTDISTDDGRKWRPLRPDPQLGDTLDADRYFTALSLPYAVGPNGRIGILRRDVLVAH
jgi:WD40 repeat protein